MIALENHATADGVSAGQLKRWLATNKLHIWQPAVGPTQICLASLLCCFEPDVVRKTKIEKEST